MRVDPSGSAVVLALAAAVAARFAPRRAMAVALALVVLGVAGAGLSNTFLLWVLTLAFAALGVGFANTGSVGVLLEGVPTERIVTAMVVWSQVWIVGYLIGPLVGGPAGEAFGFGVLGLTAMAAAFPVAVGLARR
jgi:MFS family permease